MIKFISFSLFVGLTAPCWGGPITLPQDAAGWTIFTPSADTDVAYVDPIGGSASCVSYRTSDQTMGSDPFHPAGAVVPCQTMAQANALMGVNQPDWILVKRGSVFLDVAIPNRNGESATEPFLIAPYGESGALPVFKVSAGGYGVPRSSPYSHQYAALVGLDFYAYTRDPASPDYVEGAANNYGVWWFVPSGYTSTGMMIEGCKFRYFKDNAIQGSDEDSVTGLMLRRNSFIGNYSMSTAHSQGFIIQNANGISIEENIFDHNGWLAQGDNIDPITSGEADAYNHNLYLMFVNNAAVKKNVFLRASSNHVKESNSNKPSVPTDRITSGFVVDNNLFVDGEVAVSIGAADQHLNYGHANPTVTNNVFTRPGMSNPSGREIAWFFYNFNIDGGNFSNNLMIHQPEEALSGQFFHIAFSGRNTIVERNVLYNVKNIDAANIGGLEAGNPAREGIVFRNNSFDIQGAYIVAAYNIPDLTGYSFESNKYNSTKTADTWFSVNSDEKTNAEWIAATADTSAFEQATYPDPTRSIETYMASLGETATIDAFIAKARAQYRYSWDTHYTADAVNDYIRAGFGMSEYTPTGQARRLFRNVRIGEVEP